MVTVNCEMWKCKHQKGKPYQKNIVACQLNSINIAVGGVTIDVPVCRSYEKE